MKTHRIIFLIAALSFLSCFNQLFAQNHVVEIIQKASEKIKRIQKSYGVVEATFADQIVDDTTARYNKFYFHFFSSSNRYHISAFASDEDLSKIAVNIFQIGADGKWVVINQNTNPYADVSLAFNPKESTTYCIEVSGNLKEKNGSAFFNIVVDRE